MTLTDFNELAEKLIPVVQQAGHVEMDVYRRDFTVDTKKDASPVTEADRAAEAVILAALAQIAPDIPVIAEEAASEGEIPEVGDRFFLVDPLDGTKEFIKKGNEFTVNIALVEHGQPVFGIVFAPAIKELYISLSPDRAVMATMDPDGPVVTMGDLQLEPIRTRQAPAQGLSVVASKSHMTDETRTFIEKFTVSDLKSAGSSLKLCLLARGDADLYPRFGPTMEWDTAAGHAVLSAAGGLVTLTDGQPFTYGKSQSKYLNPFFICWGDKSFFEGVTL